MSAYKPKFPGPVRATVWEGRNIFERPSDPRVVVTQGPSDAPADLLMIYASRPEFIENARKSLPPSVVQRVAAGQTTLVLDASSEGGVFDPAFAALMHGFLRDIGVPAAHTVHLTQNRDFEPAYRAWCAAAGAEPVAAMNYDYYIRRFFQEHEADGERSFADRLANFEARGPSREKRFVCLNFSLRQSKVMLLLKLIEAGLWDQGFISTPGFDKAVNSRAVKKHGMVKDLLVYAGMEALGASLAGLIDELDAKGAQVLGPAKTATGMPNHYKPLSGDMALEEYNRSWFTIITETEMQLTRRVTEKPFKALANFSPLLLLGNAGSLALIRDFGFRTFGEAFDESYDSEPDHTRRFEMVYAQIARLCAMPEAQLREVEAALTETILFNARRALIDMPRIYREEIDPRLVDDLLALRAVTPA